MPGNYNRKDHLYFKAKEEGYKSRAAYKLLELNKEFSLVKVGGSVLDLGSWPGGWLQVASEAVGQTGMVAGVDLVAIDELGLKNVRFITGDLRSEEVRTDLKSLAPENGKFDLVLSDMSPKLSGIKEVDREGEQVCANLAMDVARELLKKGGSFAVKVFKNAETEKLAKQWTKLFKRLVRRELEASRNTSNEFYVVGIGYLGSGTCA